ncbi:hypothetical protein [Qipengyuania sediminis]|uniref:hypothetical protein n=1 Tax=Qipengyuania sediminis TaxID=1532023 RepID=UPI001F0E59F4|nr:hypothetical protein [Qipengyuania sediminis]
MLSIAALALALAAPLAAQTEPGEKVRMVIVYGEDAAPAAEGDEIVVVARLPERERFRIPENLRYSDNPANTAWINRVERLEFVGASGTLSCTAVGPGGSTGCTQEMIRNAYADRNAAPSVRFGQLIAAARAERLSTIDESATEEQARVEALEREYMRRLENESAAETDDGATPPKPETSKDLSRPKED